MKRERWKRMEQFEAIAIAGPIWAGDLLSKDDTYALRAAGLVRFEGKEATLTNLGQAVWALWKQVEGAAPDYPACRERPAEPLKTDEIRCLRENCGHIGTDEEFQRAAVRFGKMYHTRACPTCGTTNTSFEGPEWFEKDEGK
jgi:hypothetical protein